MTGASGAKLELFNNKATYVFYSNKEHMCFRCNEVKSHNNQNFRTVFEIRNGNPYEYIKKICRKCEHDSRAIDRRKNRHRENENLRNRMTPLRQRERNLKKDYKISLDQYDILLRSQNGRCAICFNIETKIVNGVVSPLTVDHDHNTGRIRGLLCARCNTGIGLLMESTENFKNAITYLSRSN